MCLVMLIPHMRPIEPRREGVCEEERLSDLQGNANIMLSALSGSQSAALSLTSLFPFKVCVPSVAVVPLVITMQLFHPVTAAHIIVSDRSGLLTLVSALQKQI